MTVTEWNESNFVKRLACVASGTLESIASTGGDAIVTSAKHFVMFIASVLLLVAFPVVLVLSYCETARAVKEYPNEVKAQRERLFRHTQRKE